MYKNAQRTHKKRHTEQEIWQEKLLETLLKVYNNKEKANIMIVTARSGNIYLNSI